MGVDKRVYLEQLREESLYPAYRTLIEFVATVMVLIAGVWALVVVFGAFSSFSMSFGGGLLFLVLGAIQVVALYLGSRLFRWGALVLVDLVDSTLAHHANECDAD